MKKIITVVAAVILYAGCGTMGEDKAAIYDDEVRIAETGDSWSYIERTVDPASGENEIDVEYSGFTGLHSLWSVDAPATASLTVRWVSDVTSGDFKTVIVFPDASVVTVFEGEQSGARTFSLPAGDSVVKVAGRFADGAFSLGLEASDGAVYEKLR